MDGYSNEDEATATCFCGAVQIAFVSPSPLLPNISNILPPANPRPRSSQQLRLPLRRLPQAHSVGVRVEFHR